MSEAQEQAALFQWAMLARQKYPQLELLYHIPNGGRREKKEAVALKRQGVKAGVPDICLPVAVGEYHGLYIELKVGKNKTSKHQDEWIEKLRNENYCVEVSYGWQEARDTIEDYLEGLM
ncbi:VRR-NUC domain-containing protein [Clostridium neonatale]|uniref:VRR-NUC domain-containing protein n=1 Tax=Clostridium neonatale TaxID=137838 RepID=UPI00291B8442|nr:VRR-NUC domain-containing protein [Clostridium neonatale]CAI3224653.1 VRR-NUC domain-containing protein [Clostridium neonatale]